MTRTREAIGNFLANRVDDSPFLLNIYSTNLETQVMVDTNGDPGEQSGTYTDGKHVWGNKRWPYQAGTDPNYNDPPISFSPAEHVERVGTTWWDYVNKKSIAVGIDIDASDGHAETTTTNHESDIEKIIHRLKDLDYVTIVRSTGGKGLHVYVFFDQDNLPTAKNHHEHTVVARKTLELISQDIAYPLKDHVDCVGSVFWIWAKKSPAGHPGFSLVKEGECLDASRLASIELPSPTYRGNSNADFEAVELDDEHKRILEAIQCQPYYFNVRQDLNMIHTHTCAIRDAIVGGLEIRGDYTTNSLGDDPGSANCFMIPQRNGVFRIFRFGQSQHEPDWNFKDGKNWCTFNDAPSIPELVSRAAGKHSKGIYSNFSPEGIQELFSQLGEHLDHPVPDDTQVVPLEDGIELRSKKGGPGFVNNGNYHVKVVKSKRKTGSHEDRMLAMSDDKIRFVTQDGNPRGWFHKIANGSWLEHRNFSEVSCVVDGLFGEFARKAKEVMISNPYDLVTVPFQPEYPGNRKWNRNAPQLACEPAESGGDHPHFDLIFEHIGGDLDEAVQRSDWCRKGGILTGADYLRTWVACLIHYPDQPLPYLFMAGPQNSGKSMGHEAMRFLFDGGITSANSALTSTHNGELEGCFLVYVEERDLGGKGLGSYEKIKEWVTARTLTIHEKYQTPYETTNYLHFMQMANATRHLPLEDGDTRVVAIDVPALKNLVPKQILERHLKDEAPRFIRTLLNTVVPPPCDRLRIPALKTATKDAMERKAMSPVMLFTRDHLHKCLGHKIKFQEFYDRYANTVKLSGATPEASFIVHSEVMLRSDRFELGIRNNEEYLLNVSFDATAKPKKNPITTNSQRKF